MTLGGGSDKKWSMEIFKDPNRVGLVVYINAIPHIFTHFEQKLMTIPHAICFSTFPHISLPTM